MIKEIYPVPCEWSMKIKPTKAEVNREQLKSFYDEFCSHDSDRNLAEPNMEIQETYICDETVYKNLEIYGNVKNNVRYFETQKWLIEYAKNEAVVFEFKGFAELFNLESHLIIDENGNTKYWENYSEDKDEIDTWIENGEILMEAESRREIRNWFKKMYPDNKELQKYCYERFKETDYYEDFD